MVKEKMPAEECTYTMINLLAYMSLCQRINQSRHFSKIPEFYIVPIICFRWEPV